MALPTFNPMQVTNAAGTFYAQSTGYVSGVMLDDPAVRFAIDQGINTPGGSAVLYGGMAITESGITPGTEVGSVMSVLALASAETNITGFTVFNQSSALIQTPQSPVPIAPPSGFINFCRLGSGARIVVPVSAVDAAAMQGQPVNQLVYWDYTNQVLLHNAGGTAIPVKVLDINVGNSQVPSYNSGTGFYTWNYAGSSAVIQI
jgi:hypothetical protein